MINIFKQDNDKEILRDVYNKFKKDTWVNGNIVTVLEKNIKKFLKTKFTEPLSYLHGLPY